MVELHILDNPLMETYFHYLLFGFGSITSFDGKLKGLGNTNQVEDKHSLVVEII